MVTLIEECQIAPPVDVLQKQPLCSEVCSAEENMEMSILISLLRVLT